MKRKLQQTPFVEFGLNNHPVGDIEERLWQHPSVRREDQHQPGLVDDEPTAAAVRGEREVDWRDQPIGHQFDVQLRAGTDGCAAIRRLRIRRSHGRKGEHQTQQPNRNERSEAQANKPSGDAAGDGAPAHGFPTGWGRGRPRPTP
jgi:hypothetical protein